MDNLIGTTINHYQILIKVRETSTRILFKAYNIKAHSYVALEVVKETRGDPAVLLDLINAQAQKNADLIHPSISVVTDSGIHEGMIYIVYNFLPTHPLRRLFNRTYSWQEMAREIVPITHALAYAHENGVVHGWLNPASIVLDDKKNPILFDFGFEKIISDYITVHSPGAWINRWGFEHQAPEQLSGGQIDARSDVYSIGMIMHEWLMGRIAQLEASPLETLYTRQKGLRTKIDKKTITPIVQNLINKCIASQPADRYQSMQEVYIVLARGALDMTLTKRMVRKPLAITVKHLNIQLTLLGVGAIIALGLAGFFLFNNAASQAAAITQTTTPAPLQATKTPLPIQPTATTPTIQLPLPTTATQQFNSIEFPVYQGTSLSSVINQSIAPENAERMIMVSLWGIGNVDHLAVSNDNQHVAVASSIGIFVFDAQTLQLTKYIDTRSWITRLVFSPDGKMLASGDRDGLIQLWGTTTWQEVKSPFSGHKNAIRDLVFSPDGLKLASVDSDNTLIEWQINSENNQKIRRDVTAVSSVIYSSDGKYVITGGEDAKLNVWNADDLTLQQTTTHSGKISNLTSGPGFIVIGDTNQTISVLNLNDPTADITLGSMKYTLTSVAVSLKGDLIAGGDINGGITVWQKDGTLIRETQNYIRTDPNALIDPGEPHSLAFDSSGTTLFSGLRNGVVRKLNANTLQETEANHALDAHSSKLVISHNGKYAVVQYDNNKLMVWDIWNGKPLYDEIPGKIMDGDPFSTNDNILSVALDNKTASVYETTDGKQIFKFNNNQGLKIIQFIKQDTQLAVGNDQVMHLWSISSGEELKIKRNFQGQGCATIFDLKDNAIFAITNFQHIISTDQNNEVLCKFQKQNWTYDINETGGLIAFGGNSKLTVRDTRQPNAADREFNVNFKKIVSVAINPTGTLLAAAYDDNTIHLWNIGTLEEVFSLYGHNDQITDLQFTPDGKLLLSTSQDGTIRVWGVPY